MLSIRKLFGFILAGLLLVVAVNVFSQPSEAQRQSQIMANLHETDSPVASPAALHRVVGGQQADTALCGGQVHILWLKCTRDVR